MPLSYGRLHAALATHEKWLGLSLEQRGAWVSLLLLSYGQEARGEYRSRGSVELLLKREGAEEAAALIDALVKARLLDVTETGIRFHDFFDWNARFPSDEAEATRERKRRSRARSRVPSLHDASRDVTSRHVIGDDRENRLEQEDPSTARLLERMSPRQRKIIRDWARQYPAWFEGQLSAATGQEDPFAFLWTSVQAKRAASGDEGKPEWTPSNDDLAIIEAAHTHLDRPVER